MKEGDLVNFHSSAWVFENAAKDYANPGLILEAKPVDNGGIVTSLRYQVYWADGRVTTEYACYLEATGGKDENRRSSRNK